MKSTNSLARRVLPVVSSATFRYSKIRLTPTLLPCSQISKDVVSFHQQYDEFCSFTRSLSKNESNHNKLQEKPDTVELSKSSLRLPSPTWSTRELHLDDLGKNQDKFTNDSNQSNNDNDNANWGDLHLLARRCLIDLRVFDDNELQTLHADLQRILACVDAVQNNTFRQQASYELQSEDMFDTPRWDGVTKSKYMARTRNEDDEMNDWFHGGQREMSENIIRNLKSFGKLKQRPANVSQKGDIDTSETFSDDHDNHDMSGWYFAVCTGEDKNKSTEEDMVK